MYQFESERFQIRAVFRHSAWDLRLKVNYRHIRLRVLNMQLVLLQAYNFCLLCYIPMNYSLFHMFPVAIFQKQTVRYSLFYFHRASRVQKFENLPLQKEANDDYLQLNKMVEVYVSGCTVHHNASLHW